MKLDGENKETIALETQLRNQRIDLVTHIGGQLGGTSLALWQFKPKLSSVIRMIFRFLFLLFLFSRCFVIDHWHQVAGVLGGGGRGGGVGLLLSEGHGQGSSLMTTLLLPVWLVCAAV